MTLRREDLDLLLPGEPPRSDPWRWGTITQVSPLRVRLDGDSTALALTPDTLTTGLTVGSRVYCHINGRRIITIGLSLPGGRLQDSELLPMTKALASDVDLDTLLTPGVWHQGATANATPALHYPVQLAGLLEVQARGSGTAMVWQRYTPYHPTSAGGERFYERRHYNGTWGPWREYLPRGAEGAPWAVAAGTVGISLSSAAYGSTAVNFPAGRFSQAPRVTITQVSLPASSGLLIAKATGISTAGFTAYAYNGPGTAVTTSATFHWTAVQMTEDNASG